MTMTANEAKQDLIQFIYDELDGTLLNVRKTVNSLITRYEVKAWDILTDVTNDMMFLTVCTEYSQARVRLSRTALIMNTEHTETTQAVKPLPVARRTEADLASNNVIDNREVAEVITDEFSGICTDKAGKLIDIPIIDLIADLCDLCDTSYRALDYDYNYDGTLMIKDSKTGRSFNISA